MLAFQDYYGEKFSHCYGCGRNNPQGHQLKSYWDGEQTIARSTPPANCTGGVPGNVYGGLIASLLDCHGTASAWAFAQREFNGEMDRATNAMRFVTASLKVDFAHPTPMGVELVIAGKLRSLEGRKAWVDLTLSADGKACARGEMLAVQLVDQEPVL